MSTNENISKINLYDKLNASVLGLVTSEMAHLNKLRKNNGYSSKPTFDKPFEMPFEYVEIDNIKIRFAKSLLSESKPTLVMLNPFPQSIMAFAPIWEILKSKYNLYAYDLPGFGRSGLSLKHMTFKAQGEFLKLFLAHFNIEEPHLLGPDVGMPSILYYVGTFKNNVKSILIGDGPGIAPSTNGSIINKMVNSGFWRSIFKVAGNGALVEAGNTICYINYTPNELELSDYKKSYAGKVSQTLEWFKGYPSSLKTVDPLIDTIDQPTLIFWGKEDAILPVINGERIHKRMKNSEFKVLENCGHFSYQDDYKQFANMIINWVDKH